MQRPAATISKQFNLLKLCQVPSSIKLFGSSPHTHTPHLPHHPSSMGQKLSTVPGFRRLATKSKASVAFDKPTQEDPDLWMIVGLGNPGPRYEDTRHNVGFMLVDELAKREAVTVNRLQENAQVGRGRLCGKKILLVKPMTFMNVSGESVGRLSRFYKVPAERIMVIYDDLDLDTAVVRLRAKGGHGGHNGMKSIASHLQGSKDFPRIRIGIGRPKNSEFSIATYVLQDFNKAEKEEIQFAIQDGIEAIRAVFTIGMDKSLSGIRVDRDGNLIKPAQPNNTNPKPPKLAPKPKSNTTTTSSSDTNTAVSVGEKKGGNGGVTQQPEAKTALGAALATALNAQQQS